VIYIPGVRGGEWVVPGPFPSWASSKRTTIFRGLVAIRLEKKSEWNRPFRASFRGNRTRPKLEAHRILLTIAVTAKFSFSFF
jgi:hypothetical protein